MIDVTLVDRGDPMEFEVTVKEGSSETRHRVRMQRETYQTLTGGEVPPDRCVEAAFRFLLDREPKESILSSFDVTVISRYFPNFEAEFGDYLP